MQYALTQPLLLGPRGGAGPEPLGTLHPFLSGAKVRAEEVMWGRRLHDLLQTSRSHLVTVCAHVFTFADTTGLASRAQGAPQGASQPFLQLIRPSEAALCPSKP